MTTVAISLGSNQDDCRALLRSALVTLSEALTELTVASLYCTPPLSEIPQPKFLNTAAAGTTGLSAEDLLAVLKACEQLHGRRRGERWGPRPLDIDLLVYGDLVLDQPELSLPHPRIRERRFYLEPLAEVAPDLEVPPDGATVANLLAALPSHERFEKIPWPDDSSQ